MNNEKINNLFKCLQVFLISTSLNYYSFSKFSLLSTNVSLKEFLKCSGYFILYSDIANTFFLLPFIYFSMVALVRQIFFLNFSANFPFFSRIRLQSTSLRGFSAKPYFRSINGPCFKNRPWHILASPLMFSINRPDEFQNMQLLLINL